MATKKKTGKATEMQSGSAAELACGRISSSAGMLAKTVKRRTANIHGKLGANTRWDAVSRAVELGSCLRANSAAPHFGSNVPPRRSRVPFYAFLHPGLHLLGGIALRLARNPVPWTESRIGATLRGSQVGPVQKL